MKRTKRVFAFLIAMVCVIATVMNPLISSASVSQVNVDVYGAGGTFGHFAFQEPIEGVSQTLEVGKSLSDDKLIITDPTFFDASRKFKGWALEVWKTFTDDDGNQWGEWVQVEGTSLMTTQEILAYKVTGEYDSIMFEAKYEGDDSDYYSYFQLDLYGGEMKIKESDGGEQVTSLWSTRLKKDGTTIGKQTEFYDFSETPTKDGATFEGWVQAKYYDIENDDGGSEIKFERVSDTVYTTAQILNMTAPQYNTVFAAKWSDISIEEYYWNGPVRNIYIDAEDGTFDFETTDGWQETETEYMVFDAKATLAVSKSLKSLTDPTFFNPNRKFLGWKICELQEVTDDDGNQWEEWVQILGTTICSTKELMDYVIPDGGADIGFIAQWDGDREDYYSEVQLDLYGGELKSIQYEHVWDNVNQAEVKVPRTEAISDWYMYLKEDGSTIEDQTIDEINFSATPTKEGTTFEGWLEFKLVGESHKLVSNKLYTTAEILAMKVPHDDTVFTAKWKNIPVEDYYVPLVENHFATNSGKMSVTFVDVDGKTVTESFDENYSMAYSRNTTLKEYFEKANTSIQSIEKQCATFEGWTVTEYEMSEYVSWPIGKEFNIGDPDIEFVYIGIYYDNDEGTMMEQWLGMVNYKEYSNKMSTDEIMKLDGTKNHYFVANWKEAHTETIVGAKDATCTADGYTGDKVCSECQCTLETGSNIAATGHKPGTTTVENAVAATCTKDGSHDEVVYCTVCKEEMSRNTITDKATGHTYKDSVCTNCGDQLVLGGVVGDTDTSKPSEDVKPVVKKDAIESVTAEVKKVVDAIVSGKVTDEMKSTFSSELIAAMEKELNAGNKISTEVIATVVAEDKVDAGTAEEIQKNLGENGKLAQYLDLTVMVKSVSADGAEKELGTLKELEKEITFTIVIPENLVQDGRVFFVLRNHEGKVDKLGLIKNTDGSYSFKTDRFSTYALAYEDVKIAISDTTTSNTTSSTNGNVPETGDNSNIILYGAVAVMAVVVLAVSKKRSFVK